MIHLNQSNANAWFNISNIALLLGAISVALGTYGVIISGAAKERFADERVSRNESETAKAQAELAKANAKAAKANESAARANERAAVLEREAAAARLEQEKLKEKLAWRTLDPVKTQILRSQLSGKGRMQILHTANDPETTYLAIQFANVIHSAGWEVAIAEASFGSTLIFGLRIPNPTKASEAPITARLRAAFNAVQISYSSEAIPTAGMFQGGLFDSVGETACLFVGSRPPVALLGSV